RVGPSRVTPVGVYRTVSGTPLSVTTEPSGSPLNVPVTLAAVTTTNASPPAGTSDPVSTRLAPVRSTPPATFNRVYPESAAGPETSRTRSAPGGNVTTDAVTSVPARVGATPPGPGASVRVPPWVSSEPPPKRMASPCRTRLVLVESVTPALTVSGPAEG